jgi:hypothetical protein
MLLNIQPSSLDGRVAQLAEHSTLNRQVGGSIPPASTMIAKACLDSLIRVQIRGTLQQFLRFLYSLPALRRFGSFPSNVFPSHPHFSPRF